MSRAGCDLVARYVDSFMGGHGAAGVDLRRLSDHAESCSGCYERLARFFRTVELPDSSYLRETLDELALALFNFARALIRDQSGASDHENVRITEEGGGSVDENAAAGHEMIDDAEDFAGSRNVAGMDLEEVRDLLDAAGGVDQRRTELAIGVFQRLTAMPSRITGEAWNWLGVLLYQRERFVQAEKAFRQILNAEDGAPRVRAFANCNLAWVLKQQHDLDGAVLHARRATVLAEEDGGDPYFGLVAELYFRLLRNGRGDLEEADRVLLRLLVMDGGTGRLWLDLRMPSNSSILGTLQGSPLAHRLQEPAA